MPNARNTRAANQKTVNSFALTRVERKESPPKAMAAKTPYIIGFNPLPAKVLANFRTVTNNTNAPAKKEPIYIQKYLIAIINQLNELTTLNHEMT